MKRSALLSIQVALVALFMTTGLSTYAQKSWSTSKAVNEVANKDLFNDEELAATHLEANSSAQPAPASMKGVSRVSSNSQGESVQTGNVSSKGTPAWVNSKGVSNVGKTKARSSKKAPADTPVIPIENKDTSKE
jgi:hypothetical protein